MYDIIGDIHGYASVLKRLLSKMDYKVIDGVWQHPERKCIFVGDYIDRGPEIRETLQIVKSMTDTGNAIALMGNHEFNALAYHTKSTNGEYLRQHKEKNVTQHAQTLDQFFYHYEEWQQYLDWFYSLPLFIEISGIRVVHACWDERHMSKLLQQQFSNVRTKQPLLLNSNSSYALLTQDMLFKAHDEKSDEHQIIEDILKGKEVAIPAEYAWKDKDGHLRTKNRIKWWKDPVRSTNGEFLFHCPDALQEVPFEDDIDLIVYPEDAPPVFFGHYWLDHKTPEIMGKNVVCLDYSIAKEGFLAAYRWNERLAINNENFVVSS